MADLIDEHGLPLWPAAERNREPILAEMQRVLHGRSGLLLEIAAATGQHAAFFAESLPDFTYQPSDFDEEHLSTLRARAEHSVGRLPAPVRIDVTEEEWAVTQADIIYCANMIHIAPPEATVGLFRGAGRLLSRGGLLLTYGLYQIDGRHTSESNERFNQSLQSRNPAWGVRDLAEVKKTADGFGLTLSQTVQMPANNLFLVWAKG